MNRTAQKTIVLIVVLIFSAWIINLQVGVASKTLNVPLEYPTITSALAHASDGDTIYVQKGVYKENINLTKSVVIEGENPQTTLLIGEGGVDRGARPVVALMADGAEISGLTIQSENYSTGNFHAIGIYVEANHCKIEGNIIQNCYIGIFSSAQAYNTILNNTVSYNLKDGMRFYGGAHYTIQGNIILNNAVSGLAIQGYQDQVTNNTFIGNTRAIGLGCSYSLVYGNWLLQNIESGLYLAGSQNLVCCNQIEDNKWAIYISPQIAAPHDNTFFQNNFVDNTYGVYVNQSSPFEFWDNGTSIGGNYWSDYTQKYPYAMLVEDFYNTPYQVYAEAFDRYPRVKPLNMHNLPDSFAANVPPQNITDGLVSYWSFDSIDATGVTQDLTGNNPAVLGSITATQSYIPQTVPGEKGQALEFDGQMYVNVLDSPTLELTEATIDVWVNVQDFKDIPYNNIIVQARRTAEALPTRTFGLAINGEEPTNSSSPPVGALRGYVQTSEGLNEIDTVQFQIALNTWIHIVFARSLQTGMHIYVNGVEVDVQVASGVANPQGATVQQTETYIGHDAVVTIDELKLYNTALSQDQQIWLNWILWAAIITVVIACFLIPLYKFRWSINHKP